MLKSNRYTSIVIIRPFMVRIAYDKQERDDLCWQPDIIHKCSSFVKDLKNQWMISYG